MNSFSYCCVFFCLIENHISISICLLCGFMYVCVCVCMYMCVRAAVHLNTDKLSALRSLHLSIENKQPPSKNLPIKLTPQLDICFVFVHTSCGCIVCVSSLSPSNVSQTCILLNPEHMNISYPGSLS